MPSSSITSKSEGIPILHACVPNVQFDHLCYFCAFPLVQGCVDVPAHAWSVEIGSRRRNGDAHELLYLGR